MTGKQHYQRCANEVWKAEKTGNTAAINRVFDELDNEGDIEAIFCTCREYLQLVQTALNPKPTLFAHINNIDLVKKLEGQDREAHPNWDGNDDESNSPL